MYRGIGRLIVAGRVQVGTGYGDDVGVVSERFQLGGATTVRGYAENSLGPRDAFGFPRGGSDFTREFIAARVAPLDQGKSMADIAARLMPSMRGSRSDPEGLVLAQRIM